MCKRTWRLVFAAAIFPTLSYAAGFGDPLPGLTPAQQTKFQDGKAAIVTAEAASAGLCARGCSASQAPKHMLSGNSTSKNRGSDISGCEETGSESGSASAATT